MMRFLSALSSALLVLLISSTASAAASKNAFSAETDIFYWPVTATKPSRLAQVAYDPKTLETAVLSYTPPEDARDIDSLVRIGVFVPSYPASSPPRSALTNSKQELWSGSLLAYDTANFATSGAKSPAHVSPRNDSILLHLSPAGDVHHVSAFLASTYQSNASPKQLNVRLIMSSVGPRPHVNRPGGQQRADGFGGQTTGEEGEQTEKTFLQRYWWVFAIIAFLALSGGGGESGGQS